MRNIISTIALFFLLGTCLTMYGQSGVFFEPFSDEEIEQLSTSSGCGCYLNDQSHCSTQYYLYGDRDATNEYNKGCGIPVLYLKINGEITAFSYKSKQYSLRLTGEPEPVFDLYFDKLPNEQDVKNGIMLECKKWNSNNLIITRNKKDKNIWNVNDNMVLYEHPVDEYYLFTSEKYFIRLYEYKHGAGGESSYTKGEAFIYENGENWEILSMFFILICGC